MLLNSYLYKKRSSVLVEQKLTSLQKEVTVSQVLQSIKQIIDDTHKIYIFHSYFWEVFPTKMF